MAFKSRVSTGRRESANNELARLKAQVAELEKKEVANFVRQANSVGPKKSTNQSPVVITRSANPSVALLAFNKHIAGELTQRLSGLQSIRGVMDSNIRIGKPDGWLDGSPEQESIWHEIQHGDRHIVVNAVAGSGKTTCLIQACLRLNANTSAMTYHSLGMKAVGRAFGRLRVDEYKTWSLLDGMQLPVGDHLEKVFKVKLVGMVGKAKNYGMMKPSREELEWIVDRHDLELDDMQDAVFSMVGEVLKKSAQQTSVIDFDDMIWLPYVLNLDTPKFDIVMSDEAQDLNMIQQYLALKAGARHVVVGDRNQAIYSFRGADSKSMDSMKDRLLANGDGRGVVDMPLTLTRRCPKSHVEMAQMLVPQIQAMSDAPVGKVTLMNKDDAVKVMKPGDMVLCRVNAELLMVAYKLLKRGVKAVVRGKDIGRGIIKLIEHAEKDAGQTLTVVELMQYAGNITDGEVAKFMAIPHGRGEMRASSARDKMDCLISISEGARLSSEVKDRINQLFADFDSDGQPRYAVVLSTVHRGKGLEAGRVFILRGDLMPHPMARKAEDMEQERNLAYVAVTRAKFSNDGEGELVWVDQQSELFGEVDAVLDGER